MYLSCNKPNPGTILFSHEDIHNLSCPHIKTHDSESRDQEEAAYATTE